MARPIKMIQPKGGGRGDYAMQAFLQAFVGKPTTPAKGDLSGVLKSILQERQMQDRLMAQLIMQWLGAQYAEERQERAKMRDIQQKNEQEIAIRHLNNPNIRNLLLGIVDAVGPQWENLPVEDKLATIARVQQNEEAAKEFAPQTFEDLSVIVKLENDNSYLLQYKMPPQINYARISDILQQYGSSPEKANQQIGYWQKLFQGLGVATKKILGGK